MQSPMRTGRFAVAAALVRCWTPVLTAWAMVAATAADDGTAAAPEGQAIAAAGALAIYSADRIGDPHLPAATGPFLRGAAAIGGLAVACLLPTAPRRTWIVVAIAGALGLLHGRLRRWLPKNVVVAAAWTAVLVDSAGIAHPPPLLLAVIALTLWAACLLCDFKDDDSDARDGTITVVRLVGRDGRRWAAFAGLLLALGSACVGDCPWTAAAAAGLVPLALVPSLAADAAWGSVWVDGTLAVPGLVAAFVRSTV